MRLAACLLLLSSSSVVAADLGSPLPMPVRVSEPPVAVKSAESVPTDVRSQACPCADNCECAAGQCPACPVRSAATPATAVATPALPVTYRQVWVRGAGWVWTQETPVCSSGTCSGESCPLNRR
jgi:hypothetical protein